MVETIRQRAMALPVFAGFAAVGCLLVWLALSGLLPAMHAVAARSNLVVLSPSDAFGLPLAVSFFALAAMTLFPTPAIGKGARVRQGIDGAAVFLAVAVAGAILALLASPITRIIAQSSIASHGYAACPALPGERHPPLRWIRVGTTNADVHCPLPGESLR